MKINLTIGQEEDIVISYLIEAKNNYTCNTCGIPHYSYDKKEERKYCKKMIKSIDNVLCLLGE